MKKQFQSNLDGMTLGGGSIEHPLSIHSASDGRRWHSRGMQLICTLVLLFTFSIGQMWADEVKLVSVGTEATQSSPDFFDNKTYESGDKSYSVNISVSGTSKTQGGSYGSPSKKDYYYSLGSACDMSATVSNYFKVSATGCKISKIVVRAHSNSTSTAIMPAVGFVTGIPETSVRNTKNGRVVDTIITNQTPPSYGTTKKFENAGTLTYTFATNVSEVYFSKQIKQVGLASETSWSSYPSSSAQSVCVYGMDVYVVPNAPSCDDANASIIANTSVYVNDELDLEFSSDNTNSVAYDIKKGGSATTDASVTAGVFRATVAGTYVVTATQAIDASGHCAVEESVTITVNPKTPVESVSVAGAAAGYKGTELTFTATAQYATAYEWYVDEVKQGSDSAKLLFTPSEAKTYSIVCKAKNSFNSDWVASTAHSLTVTSLYGDLIHFTAKTSGSSINEDLPAANIGGIVGGTVHQKSQSNAKLNGGGYYSLTLASGSFQAGDTVRIVVKPEGDNHSVPATLMLSSSQDNSNPIGSVSGLSAPTTANITADIILTAGAQTIFLSRDGTVSSQNPIVVSMAVIRPMPVKSKAYDLTAVKINGTAISAADLATLKTGDDYLLDLATEYPAGPTVKFARQTTNTYEDDSQKVIDDTITVTATEVSSKWQAQATIGTITYTVKMAKVSAAKVYYYDGATKLGEEIVAINGSPVNAGDYDDKTLASFVDWYNNADLAEGHKIADIAALVVTADVNVYGKWTYNYASSVNIEQWTLDNGKGVSDAQKETQTGALVSLLGTRKFASNIAYDKGNVELDSLNDDPSKTNRNYAYLGLKVKKSGAMLDFRVAEGQTVKIKFGNVGTTPKVAINGADYADMTISESVYSYTATGNDYVSIKTADAKAVVFQQIMINEDLQTVTLPWRVTYDANGGTCATEEAIWSGSALILPNATPADADHTFAGWYDEATGGVLVGAAGASYNATDNVTLYAHYAPVEYAVNYAAGDHGSGSMSADAAGWGTEYTAVANGFAAEEGYLFAGWTVTGVDGVSTISNLGSFTMPKNDVTLTAIWEDVSKVAVIVETNVKYESLADAVAAATDGQTIQLLQNNNVTAQVEVAGKAITLDLAGYKIEYTGTSTLPSGVILVHNGANLTIDDSSDPDAGSIVAGNKAYAAIAMTKAGDDAANPAVLEINGGTFTGNYYAITGHGSRHNTQITINNGTFNATAFEDNNAIYHPQEGTLTINDGSFTGYLSAIEMRAGTLVINGGTFVSTATTYSCNPNGSGTTTVGAAIAIAQHNTQKNISVTINGGTFEGVKAINEANPQGNPAPAVAMSVTDGDFTGEVSTVDVDRFVSGGIFDHEVTNAQCAENYVPKDNGDGTYGVKPKDGVCLIKGNVGNDSFVIDEEASLLSGTTYKNAVKSASTKYPDDETGLVGWKFNSKGAYLGFTLDGTETFQENDVVEAYITYIDGGDKLRVFTDHADAAMLKEGDDLVLGVNKLLLPATSTQTLYLYRSPDGGTYQNWNPRVAYFAVYRPMMPTLTAITIDGRDGVIDEANKTVAVTIPYEADLAALTVVPTIVWNEAAASNSIVVNDGSAWIEGANTYKLTDKDGDYTIYTITLTRDVQKHAVKFYDGETLLETVEVEDATSIAAGDVPADPTKDDYIFQGWAETAGGDVVDVTSFTISAAKNFYAKWVSDGAIKLIIDGAGETKVINTEYFTTGATMASSKVEIGTDQYDYATLSGTASDLTQGESGKYIAYNAQTTKTRIKITAYNKATSKRNIYVHTLAEGAASGNVKVQDNELAKQEIFNGEYVSEGTTNRTIYLTVPSSVGDVYFIQVKAIEEGETQLKRAGEVGYSLNLDKGRMFGTSNVEMGFEGINYTTSSKYTTLSSTALTTKSNVSFTVAAANTLLVLSSTGGNYHVTNNLSEKGVAYTAGADKEYLLNATGTWYIVPETSTALNISAIAFELPKCEKPTVDDLSNVDYCSGETIDELTVSASVSDGGTLLYQWYKDGAAISGAESNTYQPTADGEYYVVVVNTLADHQNNEATSNTITVTGHDGTTISGTTGAEDWAGESVTISVTAGGKNMHYAWYTCDDAMGTNPVAVAPAVDAAELNVTVAAADSYYKVIVSGDCGDAQEAVITVVTRTAVELQDVTESTTWNWTGSVDQTIDDVANKGLILANYIDGDNFEKIEGKAGEYARRNQNGGVYQGTHLHFNTTVAGKVKFYFRAPSSGENCTITVINNGKEMVAGTRSNSFGWSKEIVVKGDVVIEMVNDKSGGGTTRVQQIVFTEATPDYSRDVTNNIGTLCVDHNVLVGGAMGATFYQIASRNQEYDYKIDFEEVLPGEELKAGEPYIFKSTTGRIDLYYGETEADAPVAVRGMIGWFSNTEEYTMLDITEENKSDILYIAQNKLWNCEDLVTSDLKVVNNRAYIVMSEVPTYDEYHNQQPNNAPIRRCLTISGDQAPAVITGVEDLNVGDQPIKVMIDGQLFILRGEKMYDAQGRLVK